MSETKLESSPCSLLPCPFCGGKNTQLEGSEPFIPGEGLMWVRCVPCDADGPIGHTRAEAMSKWNGRKEDGFASMSPLLDARRNSCEWKDDEDGLVETSCGETYCFDFTWTEHVRYCQGCGGVVTLPEANSVLGDRSLL